jgi:hypothetical protein
MYPSEKIKIYQLSKPIVDILYIPTYKLNILPYDKLSKIKYFVVKDIIEQSEQSEQFEQSEQSEQFEQFEQFEDITTNYYINPILYYQNKYFTNFLIKDYNYLFYNYQNYNCQNNLSLGFDIIQFYNNNYITNSSVNFYKYLPFSSAQI